ncbi:MAG: hypothetical protein J1F31_06565 [Erysipelotrichales bacterium]|nr:hypothetical protein [Erysipelotrichales bacterium]
MLKLLKHDLLQTYKKYLLMFGVSLVFFVLTPLLTWFEVLIASNENANVVGSILGTLLIIILIFAAFALFMIVSVLVVIYGYSYVHNTLFKKQGYLSFTLPYKTWQLVMSKILIIVFWTVCYSIVVSIGAAIMYGEYLLVFSRYINIEELKTIFQALVELFDIMIDAMNASGSTATVVTSGILIGLNSIVSLPVGIIIFLLSEAIVNSSILKSKRKVTPILPFILITYGISFISQILLSVCMATSNSIIVPLVIELIINLAVVIGGYELTIYLLEYNLELV